MDWPILVDLIPEYEAPLGAERKASNASRIALAIGQCDLNRLVGVRDRTTVDGSCQDGLEPDSQWSLGETRIAPCNEGAQGSGE